MNSLIVALPIRCLSAYRPPALPACQSKGRKRSPAQAPPPRRASPPSWAVRPVSTRANSRSSSRYRFARRPCLPANRRPQVRPGASAAPAKVLRPMSSLIIALPLRCMSACQSKGRDRGPARVPPQRRASRPKASGAARELTQSIGIIGACPIIPIVARSCSEAVAAGRADGR